MTKDEQTKLRGYAREAEQYMELQALATDSDTRILCAALAGVSSDAATDMARRIAERDGLV